MTFSQIRQYIKGVLSNIFNKTLSNIAPKFNPTETYSIGDRVIYKGDLYRFTSAHTGAWAVADASKINVDTLMERMPSTDMEEVASPLPGVMSRLPILFDESGAERVVGWYKYADGTKKPVYEKTVDCGTLPNNTTKTIPHNISNIENIIRYFGYGVSVNDTLVLPYIDFNNQSIKLLCNNTNVIIQTAINWSINYKESWVSIFYTKTTDTAS